VQKQNPKATALTYNLSYNGSSTQDILSVLSLLERPTC